MTVFNQTGDTMESELFFYQNTRNDTVALTDVNGETMFLAEYTTYGVAFVVSEDGELEEFDDFEEVPYLFQGRRVDSETSLMYFRNRYYQPQQGHWLQRDPLGYIDSYGLYEAFGGESLY